MKKHCIAMLLAGGQGSRLYALTAKVAKPSLPFGGKYRIIDFPLSNCANSGIDTVGVLTQYQPLLLNRYIGSGQGFVRELLRNPLIIATASGLVANLLGFRIPGWMEPTVSRISASSLALGLMAAGAGMQFGLLGRSRLLTVSVLSIRHLLQPLIAWGMAHWFQLDAVQTTVLLAFSALPTASTCYVLAARMGYNGPYVAGLVTLSTVLGVASLPFALGFLR